MEKEKMKDIKPSNRKLLVTSTILVVSLVVLGISFSYAYFVLRFTGTADMQNNTAAILNVSSTLTSATAINATRMDLIAADDVDTQAKTVSFSVTNENTSNVNAKYIIKLVDFDVTKNLSSQFFKWKLVVNPGTSGEKTLTGNFLDLSIATEGTSDTAKLTGLSKVLVTEENALPLAVGASDNLVFYIWLENSDTIDQQYLTNGSFSGKLSLEAFPSK